MSIKFGSITNPWVDIIEELKLISKLEFDYAEVGIELPEGSPEILLRRKKRILKLLDSFKSEPIAHTAWWVDFGSGYDIVRKSWIEEAKNMIDVAKILKASKINFHFYSIGLVEDYKPYHKEILENIVKSLREVVKYADSKKMMVMLENSPTKRSNVGIKEYKYVLDNVPNLRVHFDIAHAFVENGMKGIKDYMFTFKNKIEHIHIHDNHGDADEHLSLGQGNINFEQVAKWLKQTDYNKTITFEVFTSKEAAKASMMGFRKLI
ncbi:MAG: sugar phosphate isomerase/epimerase [Candidatus Aenigmarchaeota archaeon]|nr:sugar phosphate isomerase/epimerase [Candidatus Aenigmarchaeota archaeon]